MKHKKYSTTTKTLLILLVIFIAIVIIGRLLLIQSTSLQTSNNSATSSSSQALQTSSSQVLPSSIQNNTSSPQDQNNLAACADSLKADTERNKVDYAPGTLLVSFKTSLSFPEAKLILAQNGAGIQEEASSRDSFSSSHVLTATIPQGQEFKEICILKNNPDIRYAGLNTYFSLHE